MSRTSLPPGLPLSADAQITSDEMGVGIREPCFHVDLRKHERSRAQEMSEGPAVGLGGIFKIPQYGPAFGCDLALHLHVLLDQVRVLQDGVVVHQQQIFSVGMGHTIAACSACAALLLRIASGTADDIAASFLPCRRLSRRRSR